MWHSRSVTVFVILVLLAVHLWPVLMVSQFGAEFFTAVGVHWRPEHGYGAAIAVVVVQLAVSTLIFQRVVPRETVMLTLLGTVLLVLAAARLFPAWLPPMTNSTNLWINIACSHVGWCAAFGLRRRWLPLTVGLFVLVALLSMRPWEPSWANMSVGVFSTVAPAVFGAFLGYRARTMRALRERAEWADRERALLDEQARADERVKLAGEMHDVVTHRLSLMVLQAGALGMTAKEEATRTAAEQLRAAGCEALEELRDLIGVLRDPAGEQPGEEHDGEAPSLTELVERSRAVGLVVSLTERGGAEHISPVVSRTAYRIVREALTNVHKHAPGAHAEVTAEYSRERLRLTVRNTAAEDLASSPLPATGSGSGLAGLRRRVELVHGHLEVTRTGDGGFLLTAVLPSYVPTEPTTELV